MCHVQEFCLSFIIQSFSFLLRTVLSTCALTAMANYNIGSLETVKIYFYLFANPRVLFKVYGYIEIGVRLGIRQNEV